jgi:mannosyltransferase
MNFKPTLSTSRIGLLLVILLGFGLRVYLLDGQSLWWDELYTTTQAAMTPGELIESLFEDRVHTPLYFFVLLGWAEIGRSAFILRYFSVIVGVLTIPLIYVTGQRLNGRAVGLVAAFLLAIAPFHIWFSQDARMYSFLALNALAANYFLLRLLHREKRGDWIAYTIALTFTMYSHFLGVLILIAHYAFFSFYYRYHNRQNPERFKRWFLSGTVAAILFLVWFLAIFLISSFTEAWISWIAPVRWYEPLVTLFSFSIGPSIDPATFWPYVAFVIYLVGMVAASFYAGREDSGEMTTERLSLRLLLFWLIVPLLLLTAVSLDYGIPDQRFIYMDRYIISLLPAFVLLAAWGLVLLARQRWSPRWLLPLLLGLILLPTLFAWHNLYFNPNYAREDWRSAFNQIEITHRDNDLLLLTETQLLPHSYYGSSIDYAVLPALFEFDDVESQPCDTRSQCIEETLQAQMAALPAGVERVWMMQVYDNAHTHGFPQTRNALFNADIRNEYRQWLDREYTAVEEWQFTGMSLTLYDITGSE